MSRVPQGNNQRFHFTNVSHLSMVPGFHAQTIYQQQMIWDLITIGGGAAGFFGSITHAEYKGSSTLILEKTPSVLGKVRISGGGRCNVTHHCFDPKELSTHYPRGEKALIGPLHRWSAQDTVAWFTAKGVALKTEPDGRMFPTTNHSQTVIDCLTEAAEHAGVEVRTDCGVSDITVHASGGFNLKTERGEMLRARHVLLATGGTRLAASARLAEQLGHTLSTAVPSLFTFKIVDPRLDGLQGLSVANVDVRVSGSKLNANGPLLITHWGVSGPGILRLSAWGARELAGFHYRFPLIVDWLPAIDVTSKLQQIRESWGKRQSHTKSPFDEIPKRLWARFVNAAGITAAQTWSQLTKTQTKELSHQLSAGSFKVTGKSLNKEEFVTCGGVQLKDINMKTMESKICPGLYFAGEVMDIDGITGGFNFQSAWTSGYHAGKAIAGR
jgi:predicted Rossmann fold flavoprotein